MKNNKSMLARFFSHNITLLVLSFILAFSVWFIINMSSETETNVAISNIPVTIELSETAEDDGLRVFNSEELTASVEVSGNRVTVGSLTTSDIQIVASQTGSIIAPGTYTLPLSAKKNSIKTNYNIVSSVTPSSVTVYVDRLKEEQYTIENRLSVQLSDSNHYASTSLSQSTVNISGPETQVSQISSVAVVDTITAENDDKKTMQESLHFFNEDGKELELPLVSADIESIEVTISVMPVMTVALAVDTVGAPDNCPSITIDPSEIKIAGPSDELDRIGDGIISIGYLDFSKLKAQSHTISYDITLPSGCRVISGETAATVGINLSSYTKGTVNCKISSKIDTKTYSTDFATSTVSVTVYGPEDLIDSISSSEITAVADFSDLLDDVTSTNAVSLSVPLNITLGSKYSECWVYGTYSANVNVSMK